MEIIDGNAIKAGQSGDDSGVEGREVVMTAEVDEAGILIERNRLCGQLKNMYILYYIVFIYFQSNMSIGSSNRKETKTYV